MNRKISVIMGAYQIEHLSMFHEAVNSILKQSYPNFEFIICNDGSTDHTQALLETLAKRDARVKLLNSPQNEGLASALNRCLAVAEGDYIARQDADDISQPTRLERELDFLEQHRELSFVGCDIALYDQNGLWGQRKFPAFPKKEDFLFTMPFVHGTLMFRKETLLSVSGYRIATETKRAEDYDLLMRLYAKNAIGGNIPEQLYWFLEDAAAMNRRKYKERVYEAKVRYQGFRQLGLFPKGYLYVVKPLVVGLIPHKALNWLKKLRRNCFRPF